MKLENLLKPIKYLDEDVILRQYTKLGERIKIREGKRKYKVGLGLWMAYCALTCESGRRLFGAGNLFLYGLLGLNDGIYNVDGNLGYYKDDETSDSIAIDKDKSFRSRWNSFTRLPAFLLGVGLIGKFGIDVYNSIKNKTPIGIESYYLLSFGLGHLSLASSMYLKDTNPKILDKVPLWKRAYEAIRNFAASPVPVPSPVNREQ